MLSQVMRFVGRLADGIPCLCISYWSSFTANRLIRSLTIANRRKATANISNPDTVARHCWYKPKTSWMTIKHLSIQLCCGLSRTPILRYPVIFLTRCCEIFQKIRPTSLKEWSKYQPNYQKSWRVHRNLRNQPACPRDRQTRRTPSKNEWKCQI